MATDRFSTELSAWLEGTPNRRRRLRWWLFAAYYKLFWRMNFRWKPIIRQTALAAVPASAPLLAFYFTPMTFLSPSLANASLWSASIFALTVLAAALDRLTKTTVQEPLIADEMMMRVGEAVAHVRQGLIPNGEQERARRACLSIIEVYVRAITGAKHGEIGVSLARYEGSSNEWLRIEDRDKGSRRRTGHSFNGKFNLGHHACRSGSDPRAVYDLRTFGRDACASPTGSKSSYRSIFIVPLMKEVDGRLRPLGYVSIDSARPYDFYGNRANVMAVDLSDVIEFLKRLL